MWGSQDVLQSATAVKGRQKNSEWSQWKPRNWRLQNACNKLCSMWSWSLRTAPTQTHAQDLIANPILPPKRKHTNTHTKKTNPQKPWSFLTLITLIKLFSSRLGNAGLAVATSPLGCCWLTVSCTWLLIEETQPEQKMNNSKAYKGLLTSNWRKKNPACIKMPSNQNNPQFQSI